ncbi:carbohydrate ABC transporter permease [Microbacterium azadirachtae]|uniref:L-arabinose transport system permease protein AraQ n=1 Tax=Microbacterium azadirachtae TaxID=582680 RepID=A0A0F0LEC4_9MICO|nr:carbohydrate ABC transporter permease [Microbacterium azadirachtae]KJL31483.1 L-arabinose transport system permease protein AraQ [Microbacterium azadirachtae]
MNKTTPIRSTLTYIALAVITILMLLPFVWVFFGSFKTQAEFFSDPGAWFPKSFQVQNYVGLFTDGGFGGYMLNSIVVSAIVVVCNVLFSSMAGYALAKLRFRGRAVIFPLVIASMIVPYVALFVPQFVIVVQMGLVNTLMAIALPLLVMPLSVFIMRQFAHGVPFELLEAARLDGAGEPRIFFRVFLPLTGPGLATVAILSFLSSWNNFLWPLVVAQSQDVYTAPVGLAVASQASNTIAFGVLLAGAMVVLLPILILFLFLQKYFIQGVAATGLK